MCQCCACGCQVSNVDDVLVFHTDFLNSCLKDCMLTNPDLLKIVHKLMMVCVTFSNFVQVRSASPQTLCMYGLPHLEGGGGGGVA